MARTLNGPQGIKLILDYTDSDTPAIVQVKNDTSTFDCALDTGFVGSDDQYELSERQCEWLETHRDAVESAYNGARAGLPEYN
jgi:hypothetical protein